MSSRRIKFVKMVAAGNDFVVIDMRIPQVIYPKSLSKLAQDICQRKTGVGADGLLVIENAKKADFRMRIFNRDGSEPEMCGNGLRCAAIYAAKKRKKTKIETMAGIYEAELNGKNRVKIKMEEPKDLRKALPIELEGRSIKVNYIDTGVPHAVIFVQGLDGIDVETIGKKIRFHQRFKPRGTNVDFIELIDDSNIRMRTYERGVEGETLACGTGAVASALITGHGSRVTGHGMNVHTKGGVLKVYFKNVNGKIKDVYLEGEAKKVYNGEVDYV